MSLVTDIFRYIYHQNFCEVGNFDYDVEFLDNLDAKIIKTIVILQLYYAKKGKTVIPEEVSVNVKREEIYPGSLALLDKCDYVFLSLLGQAFTQVCDEDPFASDGSLNSSRDGILNLRDHSPSDSEAKFLRTLEAGEEYFKTFLRS